MFLVKFTSSYGGQDYKTQENEIKVEKMCYESESEMSSVLKSFPVSKLISPSSSEHSQMGKCGTFIFFPHFTFIVSDQIYSVTISDTKVQKQKLDRTKTKRSLTNTHLSSYSR